MTLTTLENLPLSELTSVFNTAFAGYYVPINFTEAGMQERIDRARIDLTHSVGVLEDRALVAFMLTGIGEQASAYTAYNAGTGVVPAQRGKRLVKKMYDWALPRWQAAGIQRASLEVIVENERAIRAYEGVGFTLGRRLRAFKKDIATPPTVSDRPPQTVEVPNWDRYASVAPFEFAWDYLPVGIEALGKEYRYYEWGGSGTELQAYAIVHRLGRIAQAGRRPNTGPTWRELLSGLEPEHAQLSWVNLDEKAEGLTDALHALGWQHIIDQYEMTMPL